MGIPDYVVTTLKKVKAHSPNPAHWLTMTYEEVIDEAEKQNEDAAVWLLDNRPQMKAAIALANQ